jgi:hypothetical protein
MKHWGAVMLINNYSHEVLKRLGYRRFMYITERRVISNPRILQVLGQSRYHFYIDKCAQWLKPQVPSFNHPRRCPFSHGPVLHPCLPGSGNADNLLYCLPCFESSFRMIPRLLLMTQRSALCCSSTTQVVTRRGPTTGARRATVTYTSVLRIFTAKRHPAAV